MIDYGKALASLELMRRESDDWHRVRDALESAQRESAAWAVIETWLDSAEERSQSSSRRAGGGYCFTLHHNYLQPAAREPFFGVARLEALEAAAAWVKEQK